MTDVGTVLRKTENRIKSTITPSRPKTKKSGCRVQDQHRPKVRHRTHAGPTNRKLLTTGRAPIVTTLVPVAFVAKDVAQSGFGCCL